MPKKDIFLVKPTTYAGGGLTPTAAAGRWFKVLFANSDGTKVTFYCPLNEDKKVWHGQGCVRDQAGLPMEEADNIQLKRPGGGGIMKRNDKLMEQGVTEGSTVLGVYLESERMQAQHNKSQKNYFKKITKNRNKVNAIYGREYSEHRGTEFVGNGKYASPSGRIVEDVSMGEGSGYGGGGGYGGSGGYGGGGGGYGGGEDPVPAAAAAAFNPRNPRQTAPIVKQAGNYSGPGRQYVSPRSEWGGGVVPERSTEGASVPAASIMPAAASASAPAAAPFGSPPPRTKKPPLHRTDRGLSNRCPICGGTKSGGGSNGTCTCRPDLGYSGGGAAATSSSPALSAISSASSVSSSHGGTGAGRFNTPKGTPHPRKKGAFPPSGTPHVPLTKFNSGGSNASTRSNASFFKLTKKNRQRAAAAAAAAATAPSSGGAGRPGGILFTQHKPATSLADPLGGPAYGEPPGVNPAHNAFFGRFPETSRSAPAGLGKSTSSISNEDMESLEASHPPSFSRRNSRRSRRSQRVRMTRRR